MDDRDTVAGDKGDVVDIQAEAASQGRRAAREDGGAGMNAKIAGVTAREGASNCQVAADEIELRDVDVARVVPSATLAGGARKGLGTCRLATCRATREGSTSSRRNRRDSGRRSGGALARADNAALDEIRAGQTSASGGLSDVASTNLDTRVTAIQGRA